MYLKGVNLLSPCMHRSHTLSFYGRKNSTRGGVGHCNSRGKSNQLIAFCSKVINAAQMRKIIEHVSLIKATKDFTEDEEKEMLDYLYTTQYQMRGILSVSLGRISGKSAYTHGVWMRFQRKEDIVMFYENSFYLNVLQKYVTPYCDEFINIDYEAEVEDDILPLFRKGEEFNSGVEFVHLFGFEKRALGASADDALSSLESLTRENMSLVVQFTKGSNFNTSTNLYTHGTVTRFRSLEAFHMFVGSAEYNQVWNSKFQSIVKNSLSLYYIVDPLGQDLM